MNGVMFVLFVASRPCTPSAPARVANTYPSEPVAPSYLSCARTSERRAVSRRFESKPSFGNDIFIRAVWTRVARARAIARTPRAETIDTVVPFSRDVETTSSRAPRLHRRMRSPIARPSSSSSLSIASPRLASSHAQRVALGRRVLDVRSKRLVALDAVVDAARDPTREKSHGVSKCRLHRAPRPSS